jgi:hypothetical protein
MPTLPKGGGKKVGRGTGGLKLKTDMKVMGKGYGGKKTMTTKTSNLKGF